MRHFPLLPRCLRSASSGVDNRYKGRADMWHVLAWYGVKCYFYRMGEHGICMGKPGEMIIWSILALIKRQSWDLTLNCLEESAR